MSSLVSRWWDSDVGYSFRSSPTAIVAAAIALVCIFGAVFAHWVAPHNPLNALMRCPDDKTGAGQFNLGSYCNAKLDELTVKIGAEADKTARDAMIREAFKIHTDDVGHLPLHQQALAWGVNKKVELTQRADNYMPFKWITVRK